MVHNALVTLMPGHTAPFLTLQIPELVYILTDKQTNRLLVLALRRLRQEDFKFKISLRHIGRFLSEIRKVHTPLQKSDWSAN